MNKNVPIILILSLILIFGAWKISWAITRRNEKNKFLADCEEKKRTGVKIGVQVTCEDQWTNKQAAK